MLGEGRDADLPKSNKHRSAASMVKKRRAGGDDDSLATGRAPRETY
jgi:hypothetical protein